MRPCYAVLKAPVEILALHASNVKKHCSSPNFSNKNSKGFSLNKTSITISEFEPWKLPQFLIHSDMNSYDGISFMISIQAGDVHLSGFAALKTVSSDTIQTLPGLSYNNSV